VRFSVVSGVASVRRTSEVATPIVLVPRSSAIRRPSSTNSAVSSGKSMIAIDHSYKLLIEIAIRAFAVNMR